MRVASEYNSFEDWPWPKLYKTLDRTYPDAKFILTTRKNPNAWYHSLLRHAEKTGPTEARKIFYGYTMPHNFEKQHIQCYISHNNSVRTYFANRNNKLLEVCWEMGSGWVDICNFLELKIPDTPFPHLNPSKKQ